MDIKLLINNKAKNFLRKLISKNKDEFNNFTIQICNQFINERHSLKLYVMTENENIVNIALLSKNDFDPFKKHINPYNFNYIYTFQNYKRKQYAYKMIEHIKSYDQFTAFCSNEESEKLFEKTKCINYGNDTYNINVIYRFP